MRSRSLLLLLSVLPTLALAPSRAAAQERARGALVAIPAGSFRPLYGRATDPATRVERFRIARDPVTRGEYLAFVRRRAQWRRGRVRALYADRATYLQEWRGDLQAGDADDLQRPVTNVSWFAARAYCADLGLRLPTAAEWEYVAAASATASDALRDAQFIQSLVTVYATRPSPVAPVDAGETNAFGVRGLHALAWEWVGDFNSILVSDDSRGVGGRDHDLFCASAAIGAVDPSNYPAFIRYALRAGLTGRSTLATLGFRCAA